MEGDDIPRKKGPGIVRSDILVINKIDIAPYVSADVELMLKQALEVRENRSVILTDCRANKGIDVIINKLIHDVLFA